MKVHVTELYAGDRLRNDIFNSYGLNILSKGTILESGEISRLLEHQIDYVDIDPRQSKRTQWPSEYSVSPKWLPKVAPLYQNAVKSCEQLFRQALQEGYINEADVTDSFHPLLENFKMERDAVSMLLLLNTNDEYTYQHCVQVGMLSYYIATWLNYDEQAALRIGTAGFLHDIGKCKINGSILNKPGKLTDNEFDQIKQHTLYGYQIINDSLNNETAAYAALQHHERMNGTGYPNGITGERLHPAAKVVSVADVYSAMISSRVYQNKRNLLDVLKELYRLSFYELDALTTHTFIRHMIPNFIGKRVTLKSGVNGVIVMTHTNDFFRPLIRVNERFIDLSDGEADEINEIIM